MTWNFLRTTGLFLILCFFLSSPHVEGSDVEERFVNHQGMKRRYLVYIPPNYKNSKSLPVVLNFHGGMGNPENQMQRSKMNDVADQYGFIVVYPAGTAFLGKLLTFNAGTCCGYAAKNNIDDVGFVRVLIQDLKKNDPVDPGRIYAVGFSNGGMLSYRLGLELPDMLAGIGVVSGDLGVDGPPPAKPIPLIHFHGLKDQNVLWNGGTGPNQFDSHPHRSIPETISMWKKWNHCLEQPKATEKTNDYTMERYEPAKGQIGAPIVVYRFFEGGHQWPGGDPINTTMLHLGTPILTVNASELMWKFFESLPKDQ